MGMSIWLLHEEGLSPMASLFVAVLLVLGAAFIYTWFTRPGLILSTLSDFVMFLFGLRKKRARVGELMVTYVERGARKSGVPSLFFIHGFSSDKGMYMPLVMLLPRHHHIVLVDMPGHGESDIPGEEQELSLKSITESIKQFVDVIQLNKEPFHIIGTSLGGAISAVYSALYPADVAKTTLVCPAMFTPVETDFLKEVRQGKCLLLGTTVKEIGHILDKCLHQKSIIYRNKQVLLGIKQQRARQQTFYERVFVAITSTMEEEHKRFIEEYIGSIKTPTQVIWGRYDQLVHVSGAEVLQKNLPNCYSVDIIDNCGHIVSFDRPKSMAKVLKKFIRFQRKIK